MNFVFNKNSGLVTSYKVDGTEYFKDGFGIQPNFWRAPNDNDYGNGAPKRLQVWKQSSKNFHVTDATMTTENKVVSLNVTYLLAAGNLYVVTYKIYPNGVVNVNAKFTSTDMQATETEVSEATRMATFTPGSDAARKAASKLEVPRIGVRFRLPAQMNNVQYFGRGPEENYIDRNHGTLVGVYRQQQIKCTSTMYVHRKRASHRYPLDRFISRQRKRPGFGSRQYDRFQCLAQLYRRF